MRDVTGLDEGSPPVLAPVVVVAPDVAEYDALFTPDLRGSLRIEFFDTGSAALRAARRYGAAAWIVSVELPDMTGFDLVEMLRDNIQPRLIWMIASHYHCEEEIRAYQSGAMLYSCKPLDTAWLRMALCGCLDPAQTLSPSNPK